MIVTFAIINYCICSAMQFDVRLLFQNGFLLIFNILEDNQSSLISLYKHDFANEIPYIISLIKPFIHCLKYFKVDKVLSRANKQSN